MKRTQLWTPDTQPDKSFTVEWDDENPDAPWVCKEDGFEEAIALNKKKNLEIVPALLAILPESEKKTSIDEEGNEHVTFKNPPKFFVQEGKLNADFSSFKDAKAITDAVAVIEAAKDG